MLMTSIPPFGLCFFPSVLFYFLYLIQPDGHILCLFRLHNLFGRTLLAFKRLKRPGLACFGPCTFFVLDQFVESCDWTTAPSPVSTQSIMLLVQYEHARMDDLHEISCVLRINFELVR
jgi:hypothetical protein